MRILKILRNKNGDGYIDVAVFVLVAMLILALIVKVVPAFTIKNQLNHFANELLREAQITGRIEIDYSDLAENLGVQPDIVTWEANTISDSRVQLDEKITVTATVKYDIGLFENFGSFPITLKGKATGKSEVFWH
ncbi:DUF4320 family protein [Xylanivirga thermophila]|uniref:DUF4320 family protein n=1 Tax=Xylanivirga thermophila TaxID=2496273 RepID=UPI001A929373|nr:DUF4320 family protein [Xylanivirga thermophila]